MSETPRDWDKELAAIDRAMARLPEPAATPAPGSASAAPAGPGPVGARGATTAWLRVLLVLILAGAMPFWPYARGCGVGLFVYLAAAGAVVVAGGWAAISTWHRRRAIGHILALLVTLWGLGLMAAEVLPRIGYAKQVARWTCG